MLCNPVTLADVIITICDVILTPSRKTDKHALI